MSVRIVVDSSANAAPSVSNRLHIIPLVLHFGEDEYIDGVTIDNKTFYEMLEKSPELPGTSQASPATFEAVFDEIKAAGDSAVVIPLSSKLSGTYHSAVLAAEGYDDIYVVDSLSASLGTGVLAARALQLVDEGKTAAETAAILEEEKKNAHIIAMLDTLEYLKRGGRISKAVSFAGELLHIKPIISLDGGEVQLLSKARGTKQGNSMIDAEIEKSGGIDFDMPCVLGYTGVEDTMLQTYIATATGDVWEKQPGEMETAPVGSIIGTHIGPGAIAVAFFSKNKSEE